jgi:hypothetical protein
MSDLPEITVDFNNVDDDDLIYARLARASRPLEEGDDVLATDGEDHECRAQVARVVGEIAYLALDWDTWRSFEVTPSTRAGVTYEVQDEVVTDGDNGVQSASAPVLVYSS